MKNDQHHAAVLLAIGCLIAYLLFDHAQAWLLAQGLSAWLVKAGCLVATGLSVATLDFATDKNGSVQQWLRWNL